MSVSSIESGWHRIRDYRGCQVVWVEPDQPRAGWLACYRSCQDAETGECSRAMLLRDDEFARVMVERIETGDTSALGDVSHNDAQRHADADTERDIAVEGGCAKQCAEPNADSHSECHDADPARAMRREVGEL